MHAARYAALAAMAEQGIKMEYSGYMDIWTGNRINKLRTEDGSFYPAFWRADSHCQMVEFHKVVDLAMPEEVEIATEGQYGIKKTIKY